VSSDPASDITDGSVIERPKVLYNAKTKTYVMWFHLELKDQGYRAARAAIAISKSPVGPYKYLRSFRPDDKMSRDMTLFEDDDGKAYLLTASDDNWTMHLAELNDSYTGTTGKQASIFVREHLEAPALFKYKGKYYFVASHCTGWAPNDAYSAVADSIWGPWTPLGNPARGPNAALTFGAQSTYVLPVAGKSGDFIFMADRWRPENAIDGRYVWLPIRLDAQGFTIPWLDEWNLKTFERQANRCC
jgi:beta-galactosidase